MAENKTKQTAVTVAAFIETIDEARRADVKALVKIMQEATGEKAKMWGPAIIGCGSYHYKYETGREGDMPLAGFSPRKSANVIYGMGFDGGAPLIAKLGKAKLDGGCLHIRKLADVDQDGLRKLIEASVAVQRAKHAG